MTFIQFTRLNGDRFVIPEGEILEVREDTRSKSVYLLLRSQVGHPPIAIMETYLEAEDKLGSVS